MRIVQNKSLDFQNIEFNFVTVQAKRQTYWNNKTSPKRIRKKKAIFKPTLAKSKHKTNTSFKSTTHASFKSTTHAWTGWERSRKSINQIQNHIIPPYLKTQSLAMEINNQSRYPTRNTKPFPGPCPYQISHTTTCFLADHLIHNLYFQSHFP